MNKYFLIRCQVLDRCFSNPYREFKINDLLDEVNASLLEHDPQSTGIRRRQLYNDINFMKSAASNWEAPIVSIRKGQTVYYTYSDPSYSINKRPLHPEEAQQLKSVLFSLSRFKGLPQFSWLEAMQIRLESEFGLTNMPQSVLFFEENKYLKNLEFLSDLYHHIVNSQVLSLTYQPFGKPKETYTVHPQFLKQYNSRWFLIGINDHGLDYNYALDRIIEFSKQDGTYKTLDKDFDTFFEDVVGVTIPRTQEKKLMTLKLKVDPSSLEYIMTKPLHESQAIIQKEPYTILKFQVYQNYELTSKILSYGDGVEVLEPKAYRDEIQTKIKQLYDIYA